MLHLSIYHFSSIFTNVLAFHQDCIQAKAILDYQKIQFISMTFHGVHWFISMKNLENIKNIKINLMAI